MRKTLFALVLLPSTMVHAQPSRIDQVLVYPGGAQVERVLTLKSGATSLKLDCLPGTLDAKTIRVTAPGVQIGEINVQLLPREAAPDCVNGPLEARIREAEDRRNALDAEAQALDAQVASLRNMGAGLSAAQIRPAGEAVRSNAQAALLKAAQLKRRIEDADRQIAPLHAERERWQKANPQLAVLTARIRAERDAELRLSYRSNRAGWQPVYRASLDSATGKVALERRAEIAQTTGEDWTGVALKLTTTQPNQAVQGSSPWPWLLNIEPPMEQRAKATFARSVAAPAPVAMMESKIVEDAGPGFDVSVFQGEFSTEFTAPGRVNVAGSGERITLALGQTALDARLVARVTPQVQPIAFLVAEAERPGGAWPAGNMQMYLDGGFVGETRLNMPANGKLDLPFGRDEQLRIVPEPQTRMGSERGLFGGRVEQRIRHAWKIESKHGKPMLVQVLEASPVSQHEDIKIEAKFDPQPLPKDWRDQQGIKAWEFTLAPNATQAISADYTLSWPKDANVSGGMR
ncbi:mucoidy inhibitor MuiA family protein [Burkholderiaceae bacterium UC74_6]